VGGVLIATAGWPWIFFVNVPVSLVAVVLVLRTLEAGGRLRAHDRGWALETALLAAAAAALLGP
jgi:hypothetical protein